MLRRHVAPRRQRTVKVSSPVRFSVSSTSRRVCASSHLCQHMSDSETKDSTPCG